MKLLVSISVVFVFLMGNYVMAETTSIQADGYSFSSADGAKEDAVNKAKQTCNDNGGYVKFWQTYQCRFDSDKYGCFETPLGENCSNYDYIYTCDILCIF